MSAMTLTINGNTRTIPDDSSLANAIVSLCKAPERVIAELNGTIIGQESWPATKLAAGDKLELITFVGGG